MENNIIPVALINEFKSENVILFIGSGLSNNAGLPTWSQLLELLRQQLVDLDEEGDKFYTDLDPNQKAQFLYDKSNKTAIIDEINEIFERSMEDSVIHKILVTLPVKTIITTNWDCLIEKYFADEPGINITPIWKNDQISMKINQQKLIKMHGDLQDPKSIIFSEDDYLDFLNDQSLLKEYISTIIATSTILFIGYSFSDFDFKLIFNYVRNRLQILKKPAYIFLPNGSDFHYQYLKERKLTPFIFRSVNHKAATEEFFNDLSLKVSIVALNPIDRLLIVDRETKAMLLKTDNLLLRNQSNLGPLSTPEKPKNESLFGDKEVTKLEIEIAKSWKKLIFKGAHAKCIICLNKNWILDINGTKDGLQRLETLKENIDRCGKSIEIVDIGMPITSNIGIHGKECCIESKKIGHRVKSYNKLMVFRKSNQINDAIDDFDKSYDETRKYNILMAKSLFTDIEDDDEKILKKYIFYKIEEAMNFLRKNTEK